MSEMKRTWIEGVEYSYDANEEYEKDGHVYCKTCHERKDGKILEFFGGKMICRVSCHCDKQREEKEAKRQKQLEIERLKSSCFSSRAELELLLNGQLNNYIERLSAYLKSSGKTYLACSIANALIEQYQITVKIRNFSQIMNEMQKCGFDFDKNAYIESLVNTSVLILDDLGIERDTSYAKEQVYNIVNSRYLRRKPTIFTTNLSYDTIQNCIESVEYQRIYSRIIEMCIPVMVVGHDYRKQIQKEKISRNKERLLSGGERT